MKHHQFASVGTSTSLAVGRWSISISIALQTNDVNGLLNPNGGWWPINLVRGSLVHMGHRKTPAKALYHWPWGGALIFCPPEHWYKVWPKLDFPFFGYGSWLGWPTMARVTRTLIWAYGWSRLPFGSLLSVEALYQVWRPLDTGPGRLTLA